MSIFYPPSPAELIKEENGHRVPTSPLKDDHSRALAVSKSHEANLQLSYYKMPTTVYGEVIVSGRNAEVCNGDETTNPPSNNYNYIPLRNVNIGSEFKYIKVISGIVQNGETGVTSASKYDKIKVEASDNGNVKARVKNGRFENVELQRSWFEEMRALEDQEKERERHMKKEDEAMRGKMRDLIPKRGRREGELVNSGRTLELSFID